MTVEVQQPFTNYPSAAPGATTFAYEFKITDAADLVVTIDDGDPLEVTVDYTITGIGENEGGNVVFTTPLTGGQNVLLRRVIALKRDTDYQQNGDFPAPVVNTDFDRLWLTMQQFAQDLLRSFKLPITTTTTQVLLQTAAERAKKALVFDESGNITVSVDDYDDQAASASASATAAAASEAAAASSETAASGSATAAAESAATINLPSLVGKALNFLRVVVGETGYEMRTPSQVRGDIGAAASGANSDITSLSGLTTPLSIAQGGNGSDAALARAALGVRGWDLVSTATASASGTIDFTGLSGSDDTYMVVLENVIPVNDDAVMQMRVSTAGTFQTSSSYFFSGVYVSSIGTLDGNSTGSNTYIQFTERISNSASRGGYSGQVMLLGASGTTSYKRVNYAGGGYRSGTSADGSVAGTGSFQGSTAAVDGLRFLFNSGNIASGNFYLYRLRKS